MSLPASSRAQTGDGSASISARKAIDIVDVLLEAGEQIGELALERR